MATIAPIAVAASAVPSDQGDEVIVLAAPSIDNAYYAAAFDDLIAYDIEFVNTVRHEADVIVIVDQATYPSLAGQIPDENIVIGNLDDIWARDFGGVTGTKNAKFRFRPDYMTRSDSRFIDRSFLRFARENGVSLNRSGLVLDGGNFVANATGNRTVITERVFWDNPRLTEPQIDRIIKRKTGATQIAYLPEEPGDTTGHSDGMVMWLDDNTIVLNENIEPQRTNVIDELYYAFGDDLNIIEVPIDWKPTTWRGFGSACGLHVNSLTTASHIYVPTYGQANDDLVLDIIAANTDKTIVPIDASGVCHMGGAVRCLSWLASGDDARALLSAAGS